MAAITAMAALIPFINKAYFQDSYIFLKPAEQILKTPLDPYGIVSEYLGPLIFRQTHPPLTSYLIAPVAYFGDIMKEWQVNAIFILLAGLTAFSVYHAAKKLTPSPLAAALLFVSTPAFLVSSSQVNADPVALVFWVMSTALFLSAVDNGATALFVAAGVAAGLSCLASFTSLCLFPLFGVYLILKRYWRINAVWTFVMTGVLFSLWCVENYVFYGRLQLLSAAGAGGASIGMVLIKAKLVSALSLMGGAGLFPLAYLYAYREARWGKTTLLAFAAVSVLFVIEGGYSDIGDYSAVQKAMLAVFLTAGLAVFALMARELFVSLLENMTVGTGAEKSFFLLWFWGVILYNIAIMPFESARYLLPAYVPLAVVITYKMERSARRVTRHFKTVVSLSVVLGLAVSVSMLYADYVHANIYRSFSRKVEDGRYMGSKAYFDGNWGFWFYMEKRGALRRHLYRDPMKKGDILIRPIYSSPVAFAPDFKAHLEPIDEHVYDTSFPVRTLSKPAEAGFYSQVWGFLPYSFSEAPLDTFSIYRYREFDQRQPDFSGVVGELYGQRMIRQNFTARSPEITGMAFLAGTYARTNTGHLDFTLSGESGGELAKKTVVLDGVKNNEWMIINFPTIKDAEGKKFVATLASPDSSPGNSITFYRYNKTPEDASLTVDGVPADGSLAFAVYR
jgi:Dolichyl-phosphate-mannose-protein mannosyltransferase